MGKIKPSRLWKWVRSVVWKKRVNNERPWFVGEGLDEGSITKKKERKKRKVSRSLRYINWSRVIQDSSPIPFPFFTSCTRTPQKRLKRNGRTLDGYVPLTCSLFFLSLAGRVNFRGDNMNCMMRGGERRKRVPRNTCPCSSILLILRIGPFLPVPTTLNRQQLEVHLGK